MAKRAWTPRDSNVLNALVKHEEKWGPVLVKPATGFKWESGPLARWDPSGRSRYPQRPRLQCLWCGKQATMLSGVEFTHTPTCPTQRT